jgi:hypothetical protein
VGVRATELAGAARRGTTFHFVTDGIHSALEQAMAAAGGKDSPGATHLAYRLPRSSG